MESNIFVSVVAEPAADSENNALPNIVFLIVGPIIPFSDIDDVKGSGLNQ